MPGAFAMRRQTKWVTQQDGEPRPLTSRNPEAIIFMREPC